MNVLYSAVTACRRLARALQAGLEGYADYMRFERSLRYTECDRCGVTVRSRHLYPLSSNYYVCARCLLDTEVKGYCAQCDYDRHLCPGCGVNMPHGAIACKECEEASKVW